MNHGKIASLGNQLEQFLLPTVVCVEINKKEYSFSREANNETGSLS